MFECIMAWVLLIGGIIYKEPLAYIASGAFAIATQISRVIDRMDDKNG